MRKPITRSILALAALSALAGCDKHEQIVVSGSGLRPNKNYRADSAVYEKPTRMFTAEGEVTDARVISDYQQRHLVFSDTRIRSFRPYENLWSSESEVVYFNGLVPNKANVSGDVIIMRQQDTGFVGHGTPNNPIEFLFNAERDFLAMREEILDMQESYTKVDRIDDENYSIRECFHVKGSYANDVIRLPSTFVANRVHFDSYPFALKTGVVPKVPAGDTLLVREGYVELR